MGEHTLTERTYTNADGTKVVPEDSPEAAYLLGDNGDVIPEDQAKKLGLGKKAEPAKDKAKS